MTTDGPRSITIGGITFQTKTAAEEHVRKILNRWLPAKALHGSDLAVALDIIEQHPTKARIKGDGILCVEIQDLGHGHRRFIARGRDGSIRDFSWRPVVYPRSERAKIIAVARAVIQADCNQVKVRLFDKTLYPICPVSKLPLTWENCDVDHIPPCTFRLLFDRWLGINGLLIEDIEVVNNHKFRRMNDAFLEDNWRQFHYDNAKLRVVHRTVNQPGHPDVE